MLQNGLWRRSIEPAQFVERWLWAAPNRPAARFLFLLHPRWKCEESLSDAVNTTHGRPARPPRNLDRMFHFGAGDIGALLARSRLRVRGLRRSRIHPAP